MHKMADAITGAMRIPLQRIAARAEEVKERGIKRVGLLVTELTMEQVFYKGPAGNRLPPELGTGGRQRIVRHAIQAFTVSN
jgi:aspartate/glutamate racemase